MEYSDAEFADDVDDTTLVSADEIEDACPLQAAVQASPIVDTPMVSYVEDDDIDDHAFLQVRDVEPAIASYQPLSYAPVDDDDVIEVADNDVPYVAASDGMSTVSYVPVDDDVGEIDGGEVTYVAANDIDQPCRIVARTCSDAVDTDEISYVPVDDSHMQSVSYVPANNVETISYVPVDDVEAVSYAPASNVVYSDAAHIDADNCPM